MKKQIDIGLLIAAGILVILITGVSFLAGYALNVDYAHFNYPLFSEVYQILEKNGLKAMPAGAQTEYELIRGLIKAYDDPYTVFVEPIQHEIQSNQLAGKFGGIGAEIQLASDGSARLYPYVNSPAAAAGIPDGCILLEVNDIPVASTTTADEIISVLRGDIGSRVKIVCDPPGADNPIVVTVQRQEFAIPSVISRVDPDRANLGFIKITSITATTVEEITESLEKFDTVGVTAVVLDLRGNGGGLVDSGVSIAELFLRDNSPIINIHYPDRPEQSKKANGNGPFHEVPLFIFIDQGTASSAEIVAGALQASNRAQVIGKTSFGKDTIQLVFDLDDGSSVHVSAARWSLPGNPDFQSGVGIHPDILLSQDSPTDDDYREAILRLIK